MTDVTLVRDPMAGTIPERVLAAEEVARSVDYPLSSSHETGALLRLLAASKPGGRILELGTGVGVGSAWLLDGMAADTRLDTVELSDEACELTRGLLGSDPRITVHCAHVRDWIREHADERFDLIFVDAGTPKFFERDQTVALLAPGGIMIADDLLPQEKWVASHPPLVNEFRATIHDDDRLVTVLIDWASGLSVSVRR